MESDEGNAPSRHEKYTVSKEVNTSIVSSIIERTRAISTTLSSRKALKYAYELDKELSKMDSSQPHTESLLTETLHRVPGSPFASLGLGCVIIASETDRLPMIATVDVSGNHFSIAMVVALLAICASFGIVARSHRKPTMSNFFYGALACLMSASIVGVVYYPIGLVSYDVTQIARIVMHVAGATLLLFWVTSMQHTGAKSMAVMCSIALVFDAATYAMTAFLRADIAGIIIAALPVISIAPWAFCRSYTNEYEVDRPKKTPDDEQESSTSSILLLGVVALCYAVVFGQVHYQWTLLQDQAFVSMIVQLSAGTGVLAAAFIVVLLAKQGWKPHLIYSTLLIIAPLLLLALYLSVISSGEYIFVYLALLNAAHKVVLVSLVLMATFLLPSHDRIKPFCLMYIAYFSGIVLSSLILDMVSSDVFSFVTVIAVGVLLVSIVIKGTTPQTKAIAPSQPTSDPVASEAETVESGSIDSSSAQGETENPSPNVAHAPIQTSSDKGCLDSDFTEKYHLTKRETQVFALLARGYNAASIGSELYISTTTAKTHIRNIYSKLGIHSQQELVALVNQAQRHEPRSK